ncbi:hypothetical protein [Methylobacterium sp. E-045]|uniref:hypothetical protein n=1 Tax=Methylobacterium sp. E-045 TaxID=2836575 RepID=UPI001FB96E5E|nr:hypothetical protein [Methylobacterium sp. E-045]MCJ2131935.1 hypothetical protein [Methylobacterium sp. E-045]
MTLIAGFIREDGLLLLGDALLTSDNNDFLDHPLPTMGLPNESKSIAGLNFYVAGMCRKVVPITDQTCIVVSGDIREIQEYLNRLVNLCRPGFYSEAEILSLCEKSGLENAKFSFMFASCGDGRVNFIHHRMIMQEQSPNRRIFIAGSGQKSFNKYFLKHFRRKRTDAGDAIKGVVSLCSSLIFAQYRGEFGISERYGGFFEAIFSDEGGFKNISNVLYVYRNWWFSENSRYAKIAKEVFNTDGVNHNVEAIIYMTHVGDNMLVARWLSGDIRLSFIPSLLQHRATTFPLKFDKIDLVVETVTHGSGAPAFQMVTRGTEVLKKYSVKIDKAGYKVDIPNDISEKMVTEIKKFTNIER